MFSFVHFENKKLIYMFFHDLQNSSSVADNFPPTSYKSSFHVFGKSWIRPGMSSSSPMTILRILFLPFCLLSLFFLFFPKTMLGGKVLLSPALAGGNPDGRAQWARWQTPPGLTPCQCSFPCLFWCLMSASSSHWAEKSKGPVTRMSDVKVYKHDSRASFLAAMLVFLFGLLQQSTTGGGLQATNVYFSQFWRPDTRYQGASAAGSWWERTLFWVVGCSLPICAHRLQGGREPFYEVTNPGQVGTALMSQSPAVGPSF